MTDTVLTIITRWGYFGVFFLIAAENIFPPIPSEVILTFAGYITVVTRLTYGGTVAAATAGSIAGAVVLYLAGRAIRPHNMTRLLNSRAARVLRIDPEAYARACARFAKNGALSVLFLRCVPILRSVISVPAGMAEMNFALFLLLSALGSTVWNLLLVGLGRAAGACWGTVSGFFAQLTVCTRAALAAAVLVPAIVLYVRHCLRKNKEERTRAQEEKAAAEAAMCGLVAKGK